MNEIDGAPDTDTTPTPAPSIPTELEPSPTPAPIPSRASLALADDDATPFPTFSRYTGGGAAAAGGDGSSQYPTYNYNNNNNPAETLIPVPPEPDTLTPLVVTRFTNNCNYVLDNSSSSSSGSGSGGTVNVSVPSYNTTLSQMLKDAGEIYANNNINGSGNVTFLYDTINTNGSSVAKMLAGGASAFDNGTAIIVSYNSLGTEGGVWAITSTNTSSSNTDSSGAQQQSATTTTSLQTLDSDQLGWDVAISSSTYVAGAPGYNGTWIPLIGDWYWAGRGVAYVMTRRNDKENGVVGVEATTAMIGEGGIEWEVEEVTNGSGSEKEGGEEEDWYQEGILIPSVADDNSDFGSSVDIAGKCVL